MTYHPLKLPPGTPRNIEILVRERLDPLLADVHSMLRLPIDDDPGLRGGCNLTAALTLLAVANGVTAELYDEGALDKRDDAGERFKRCLTQYFPWTEEPAGPNTIRDRHAAEILYNAFRNPLDHGLGLYQGSALGKIKVAKGPIKEDEIERIELASLRPHEWTKPTLFTDSETKAGRTKTVLTVKCLYWGVRRMIHDLVAREFTGRGVAGEQGQPQTEEAISPTATTALTYGPIHITKIPSGSREPDSYEE